VPLGTICEKKTVHVVPKGTRETPIWT